jgi:hypothetical protein
MKPIARIALTRVNSFSRSVKSILFASMALFWLANSMTAQVVGGTWTSLKNL